MEKQKSGIRDRFRRRKGGDTVLGQAKRSKRKIIRSYKSPGKK